MRHAKGIAYTHNHQLGTANKWDYGVVLATPSAATETRPYILRVYTKTPEDLLAVVEHLASSTRQVHYRIMSKTASTRGGPRHGHA